MKKKEERADYGSSELSGDPAVMIACAGAVSDAKITGRSLHEALAKQPGDEKDAFDLLRDSPVDGNKDDWGSILHVALGKVESVFKQRKVWNAVKKLARACLNAGGRLSKSQIEQVLLQMETFRPLIEERKRQQQHQNKKKD